MEGWMERDGYYCSCGFEGILLPSKSIFAPRRQDLDVLLGQVSRRIVDSSQHTSDLAIRRDALVSGKSMNGVNGVNDSTTDKSFGLKLLISSAFRTGCSRLYYPT